MLRIGFGPREPLMAHDFMTLAVGEGLGARNVKVGDIHPSHGVMTVEYPVTWLGRQLYQVREIGRARLPPRFASAPDNAIVRVVHTSEEACKESFIRSAYGAPCVEALHPDKVNMHYAPAPNFCGHLGTSHRLVETSKGVVPVVPALIGAPDTQALIVGGAHGSSLAYTYTPRWAEDIGDVTCGDTTYRAVMDYDILHVLGIVNHMVVACTVQQARGKQDACLIFDLAVRPPVCYPRDMAIHKFSAAAAAALAPLLPKPQADALSRDLAVEVPDDLPADAGMWLGKLTEALSAALAQRDQLAGALGQAETNAQTMAGQMTALQEDARVGRDLAIAAALETAAGLGVKLHRKDEKHPDGVDSVMGVKHAVVKTRNAAAYDKIPAAARDSYVCGAWDTMVNTKTAQDTNPDGNPLVAPPSTLAAILSGKYGKPAATPQQPSQTK